MRYTYLLLALSFITTAFADTVQLGVSAGSLQVPLKVVYSTDSQWNVTNITEEMNKVNRIYSQCGVQFNPLTVIQMDMPYQIDDEDFKDIAGALVRQKIRRNLEPVLVFSGAPTGELEFRNGHLSGGVAFAGISNARERTNLAFVFQALLTSEYKRLHQATHSPVAHELAHVFLDSDHVRGPNVLSRDMHQKNDQFNQYQCEVLRKSPLVKRK